MPKGNFRSAWLAAADKQGPIRRVLMRAIARSPEGMEIAEKHATEQAAKKFGASANAMGWEQIIVALLPILLELLKAWLEKK